ncbi:MAG: TonB-dependent receptor, partial [Xanthomonadales bacterium]
MLPIQNLQAQQDGAGSEYANALEEIVVTARKREESAHDVPISIVALAGDMIRETDLNRLEELQLYVPNLTVTETGIGSNLSIRGIGSGENQGFEQSVGTYVDGIYRGRAQQSRIPFMDLEGFEVLRGPQNTLFGMNSIAGALNIRSARPTDTLQARVSALYEPELDDRKLDGFISGPFGDTLSGRLAFRWRDVDGYTRNLTLDTDEANREERAVRGTLAWMPGTDWNVTLKIEHSRFDTVGRNIEIVDDRPAQAGPFAGLNYAQILQVFGQDASVANNYLDYRRSSNGDSSDNEANEYVLTVDYGGWGDFVVTSVTGWSAYEYEELCDCDFTGGNVFNALFREDFDQFSQEFRVASPAGRTLDYVAGVFYQTNDLAFFDTLLVDDGSIMIPVIDALAGPGFGQFAANTGTPRTLDQDTDTLAAYGQATWSMSDATRLN